MHRSSTPTTENQSFDDFLMLHIIVDAYSSSSSVSQCLLRRLVMPVLVRKERVLFCALCRSHQRP